MKNITSICSRILPVRHLITSKELLGVGTKESINVNETKAEVETKS